MAIQIGRKKQVPIYEEVTTTGEVLSSSTLSNYFTITQGSPYGWTYNILSGSDIGLIESIPDNVGINSSTATITFEAVRDLPGVRIDYIYYTETNYDKITVSIGNETLLNSVSGIAGPSNPTTGSISYENLVMNRTIYQGEKIIFKYVKDPSQSHTYESYTKFTIQCPPYTTTTTEITGYEEKIFPQNISNLYLSPTKKVIGGWIKDSSSTKRFYGKKINSITYTGNYTQSVITINNAEYDLFELTTSGTLTLANTAEVWLCGGGAGGRASVRSSSSTLYGGGGGGGGYFSQTTITSGSYSVTIGAGGKADYSGGATSFSDTTAKGGGLGPSTGGSYTSYGGSGGSGGGSAAYKSNSNNYHGVVGSGSGSSTYPFGVTSLKAHCAGGGGGAVWGASGGDGGSDGSNGKIVSSNSSSSGFYYGGVGGVYGGGSGGDSYSSNTTTLVGSSATFYGGGGGGGGFYSTSTAKSGGKGYQGVVYIAIPK